MKVGILTPWFPTPEAPYGGVFVAQQASALQQAGHDVTVVHLDPISSGRMSPEQAAHAKRIFAVARSVPYQVPQLVAGVRVVRLPFHSKDGVGFFARAEAAREQLDLRWHQLNDEGGGFDILHAHVTMPAGYAAIGRDIPVVTTEHFTGVDRILSQKPARQAFLEVVDSCNMLCVSDFLRSTITRSLGIDRSKIDVVPNMVDFCGLDFNHRTTLGMRWIYVGSLNARKNVDLLIRSFAHFHSTRPNATLTIVGGGELENELITTSTQLGINDSVAFLGSMSRAEAAAELQRADLLVHLSSLETFGLTCIEAISAGIPVVSRANGGAECAWGPIKESSGLILSPYLDEVQIAAEIDQLVGNRHTLDLEFASRWVRQQYAPSVISARLTEIYQGLIS